MLDFAQARRTMVDCQLRTFDVTDLAVLAAMDEVPRELFVPEGRETLAYSDQDLPVAGSGGGPRLMLKPMVLGRMIQTLDVGPGMRVLDVAGGLGYGAAILRRLGAEVTLLESDQGLADAALERLARLGVGGITAKYGPLENGFADGAPYDAILVNGAVEMRPERLLAQLADRGRLICVEGRAGPTGGVVGKAMLYVRAGDAFGPRSPFGASAPLLPAFRQPPAFVF